MSGEQNRGPAGRKYPIGEEPEGFIGLRGAMTRAEVKAAEDEASTALSANEAARESTRLAHETRTILADAQYRAKLLNGDTSFDALDMADLDTLLGIADGMTQRRRAYEKVLL